ncbi:MAG: glycosyltransferase family 4 protein [Magnetococcales bacterium]|nr:glycosyltransferase family 4 protein [Magnetococcales bacterium]
MAGITAMSDLRQLELVLFFTDGVSLETWERQGMLQREIALYRALRPHLKGITFVTYGTRNDLDYGEHLDGIRILCNRWHLSRRWYLRTFPLMLRSLRTGPVLFKSNQINGAESPLYLAQRFAKPCIVRCGYLPSDHLQWRHGRQHPVTQQALSREKHLFTQAHTCVVAAPHMKIFLQQEYGVPGDNIRIHPNYVDTTRFAPNPEIPKAKRRLLFIGRLEQEKNPFALVEACQGLDCELWIVGDGHERQSLETLARERQVRTRFLGIRPHNELPDLFNSATAFVLPSHWEGHPKTLLEALSCGLPCIGSAIPSIMGVITHGHNGLLCDLTPPAIQQAILQVLDQPALQEHLGHNARQYALEHLRLERIVEQELDLYRKWVHA